MPISTQRDTSQISAVDVQRVEDTLSLIAPRWTTWVVQTLAQQHAPMRVRDISVQLPFVSMQAVGKRLTQMHLDGLVTRTDDGFGSPYQLSTLGTDLAPVHRAMTAWSKQRLSAGRMADAERVEDAVRRLHLRHTTAVIQALDNGPLRFVRLSEAIDLDAPSTRQRLIRLQADGLVTRTGPRHGDPYTLTDAGRALSPVYAAVEDWNSPATELRTSTPAVATATRTHRIAAPDLDCIRTAAAQRRSPVAPSSLFSHAPQPQPPVTATMTAQPSPSRGR